MKNYVVSWTEIQEMTVSVDIEASSEEEAIEKAQNGDYVPERARVTFQDTLETKNFEAEES